MGSTAATLPRQVSCIGDSHTRGVCGAPWVPALETRLGCPCVNHGADGETAAAITRRAAKLDFAERAVVLAGTNDALLELAARAGNSAMAGLYRRQSRLPEDYEPSAGTFGAAFRRLLRAVPAGRVVAVSLPPLGEAAAGAAAEVVGAYNAEIRAAVAESPNATYAAFGEALRPRLPPGGAPFDASSDGFGRAVRDLFLHRALRAVPLGPSFGALARLRGRRVLHDQIHLTEASAATLVEVVAEALEER